MFARRHEGLLACAAAFTHQGCTESRSTPACLCLRTLIAIVLLLLLNVIVVILRFLFVSVRVVGVILFL